MANLLSPASSKDLLSCYPCTSSDRSPRTQIPNRVCFCSRAHPPVWKEVRKGSAASGGKEYLTILGWFNSLRRETSRIEVEGTPSSCSSKRIFFKAIKRPVTRSFALYTTP